MRAPIGQRRLDRIRASVQNRRERHAIKQRLAAITRGEL